MHRLSQQLARSALDAAPDAMIIIDDSGAIRFANRQVSALFGYSHDELVGKPVEDLIPERFRVRHPSLRQAYMKDVRVRPMGVGLNLFGQRRDGSEFPVEISLSRSMMRAACWSRRRFAMSQNVSASKRN